MNDDSATGKISSLIERPSETSQRPSSDAERFAIFRVELDGHQRRLLRFSGEFRLGLPQTDDLASERVGERCPSIRIMWVELNGSAEQRLCAFEPVLRDGIQLR